MQPDYPDLFRKINLIALLQSKLGKGWKKFQDTETGNRYYFALATTLLQRLFILYSMEPAAPPFFRKFEPLTSTLKEKFFLFCVFCLLLFLLDLHCGSPATAKVILFQFKLRGADPAHHSFRLTSIFGVYNNIPDLARVMDKAGAGLFTLISGFNLARGVLLSFVRRAP